MANPRGGEVTQARPPDGGDGIDAATRDEGTVVREWVEEDLDDFHGAILDAGKDDDSGRTGEGAQTTAYL